MVNVAKQVFIRLLGRDNALRLYIAANRLQRTVREQLFGAIDAFAVRPQRFAVKDGQTFFGYYDKTPFSHDNKYILAMLAPLNTCSPHPEDQVVVGYFEITTGLFHPIDQTSTWCWQQGCRLQWFPENEDELVIYNKMVNRSYGSVVQNIRTKEISREYQKPIYEIDGEGVWALSLNFSRLQRLRPGYGYVNIDDDTEGDLCPKHDGVWRLSLLTGKTELVLGLDSLARLEPWPSMEKAEHYVNHLAFNPSGDRFMFFHLWVHEGRRYSRLITSDLNGGNLNLLTNRGKVSHYTWKSDRELLVTIYDKKGVLYWLLRDSSDHRIIIGEGLLDRDGHPSYSPEGRLLLTDTYPDRYAEQLLLLYTPQRKLVELGRFFTPPRFRGEVKCDLHPRWDRTGRYICFDSAHEGGRALYVIDIEDLNL